MAIQRLQEAYLNGSQYSIAGTTGAVAAASGTKIIFYAQWTSTTRQALITNLEVTGHIATTAYAVGQVLYEAHIARGFTAENGTPHGTALTLTGAKLESSFPNTGFGVIRITDTTAAGITAPTWTLDANPIGNINTHSSAGVNAATPIIGSQYISDGILFKADIAAGEDPIILNTNEGVGIRVTVPATGVAIHGVQMKWVETDRIVV